MQSHHCLSHYDKCFPSGSIKNYVFFQSCRSLRPDYTATICPTLLFYERNATNQF
jgi:hypothetical protein